MGGRKESDRGLRRGPPSCGHGSRCGQSVRDEVDNRSGVTAGHTFDLAHSEKTHILTDHPECF